MTLSRKDRLKVFKALVESKTVIEQISNGCNLVSVLEAIEIMQPKKMGPARIVPISEAKKLRKDGLTIRQIAAHFNCSISSVQYALKQ